MHGLIFDVDGVIADSEALGSVAAIEALEELFGIRGAKRADFEAGVGRGAEEYIKAGARSHGMELEMDQVIAAGELREKKFLKKLEESPLSPFPGVLELMKKCLARNDFRLAIATSSSRTKSQAVLRSAGVPYERMGYVNGNDVENKKPHPEIFLAACGQIDLAPKECTVVEDSPNGIQAAIAAGCSCIAVTNTTSPEKLQEAHLIVASLQEVTPETVYALREERCG